MSNVRKSKTKDNLPVQH